MPLTLVVDNTKSEPLNEVIKQVKPSKKPRRNSTALKKAYQEIKDRFLDNPAGDWTNVKGSTIIGLYAWVHEKVYGVFPEELADEWYSALSSANKLLEKAFNNDGQEFVKFIKWTWNREKKRLNKFQDNASDFRISWRYQFSQKLLTDYRVSTKRYE